MANPADSGGGMDIGGKHLTDDEVKAVLQKEVEAGAAVRTGASPGKDPATLMAGGGAAAAAAFKAGDTAGVLKGARDVLQGVEDGLRLAEVSTLPGAAPATTTAGYDGLAEAGHSAATTVENHPAATYNASVDPAQLHKDSADLADAQAYQAQLNRRQAVVAGRIRDLGSRVEQGVRRVVEVASTAKPSTALNEDIADAQSYLAGPAAKRHETVRIKDHVAKATKDKVTADIQDQAKVDAVNQVRSEVGSRLNVLVNDLSKAQ